ncbi:cytochrome C assembly family protein [Alteromonas sp. a30]|uniref:cytochrome C assembly family protein n=1 Tax=Alteromonas sp. a30 TaxID=2730917 RepID=UPI00227E4B89|nr:cytochrome c biogenesis protein CcsA [Alteromonas sp. a30]MCY7295858.1 cytochrome c biogenesis protein CcsA [Alteromonas sp. a30]
MFLLITIISILLYALATGLISSRLFHQDGPNVPHSRITAILALLLHGATLFHDVIIQAGQNLSITNVASIVAWIMAATITAASFGLTPVFLMPMVYSFAALVLAMNAIIPAMYLIHIELHPSLLIHISLALFAYGTLMISVLYTIQYSYINYRLKHIRASILHSSLPPLMRVEKTLFRILLIGISLLFLSLASGFIFLDDMFAQKQVHKTILSLISFIIFSGVWIGHKYLGWRGNGMVSATFIGAILLTLAYFGSRIVKEIIL